MTETATLKVGDEAPDFELPSHPISGDTFQLSAHRGERAVVINFVPAAFSPVCTDQLSAITERLAGSGAAAVVISSDNTWTLEAWKQETGVDMPMLSDFNPVCATADQYGVRLEGTNMANRVVVVVDRDGKVAHVEKAPEVVQLPDYGPVVACLSG